ncbi:hypothetical protein [Ruegeria arenilitoris]|uniref:hypothetical protein n=1 Tax=Ruegeria arenilitoris TaxID=1173585 RepID=UPI0014808008|nr:hypothetical protein [Ruegeria arenilitoris]
MSHTASAPRGVVFRFDLLIVIALTGVLGFTLGQTWPTASTTAEVTIPSEDWHGNVRRSTWPD